MCFRFKVGDKVKVTHPSGKTWVGYVEKRNDTDDGLEYEVSNAPACWPGSPWPLLVWENEMSLVKEFVL